MSKAFSSFDAVFVQFTWMDRDVVYAPALANHAFHFRISKICHVLGLDPVGTPNKFNKATLRLQRLGANLLLCYFFPIKITSGICLVGWGLLETCYMVVIVVYQYFVTLHHAFDDTSAS